MLDPESGYTYDVLLRARNVVACRANHPLMRKRKIQSAELLDYPWVEPLPGSPIRADVHAILMSIGMKGVPIRYSGGSLMSVVNYLSATDALTVLPHSVVFTFRKTNLITALPTAIPQPNRSLAILRRLDAPRNPATAKFSSFLIDEFSKLRLLIERHENAVVWGR